MKLDEKLIKDLYDTLAFDEAPSGDDKTDADVYRKHHNKLIQSLYLLECLSARNAILEAGVAFKGFDELPEGGPFRIIELRRANGKINKGDKINFDRYKNNPDFTGWRYPVGDLSKEIELKVQSKKNAVEAQLEDDLISGRTPFLSGEGIVPGSLRIAKGGNQ